MGFYVFAESLSQRTSASLFFRAKDPEVGDYSIVVDAFICCQLFANLCASDAKESSCCQGAAGAAEHA